MQPYIEGQNLYNVIKAAVPEFVQTDYPLFVSFVEAFLRYLETKRVFTADNVYPDYAPPANSQVQVTLSLGQSAYEARKLQEYRDICTTLDEFVPHFLSMFAKNWPRRAAVPADLLVHSLREFYKEKGTSDTIRWFFRTVFGRDADVHYPREDVLKASDGTWYAPITIKVTAPLFGRPNSDVSAYYVGQRIVTATGTAQVESVTTSVVGQQDNLDITVNELRIKFGTIIGGFFHGQDVYNIDSDSYVHTTILPVINEVTVNNGGSGYEVGDTMTFTGGGGYDATGLVSRITTSSLNGVGINDAGDGFVNGTFVVFTSSSGTGAAAVIDEIVYGNILFEDLSGYVMMQDQTDSAKTTLLAREDKNVIDLLLTIGPFVTAPANVPIYVSNTSNGTAISGDYGTSAGIAQLNGVDEFTSLGYALAAEDYAPFMYPWTYTGVSTVELANVGLVLQMSCNTFMGNTNTVFSITNAQDRTTTNATAAMLGTIITSSASALTSRGTVYLKDVTGLGSIVVGTVFKQDGAGVQQTGKITTTGAMTVTGKGTLFTLAVQPNTHVYINTTSQFVVSSVTNNEHLTATTTVAAISDTDYSVIPTGSVMSIEVQAQRYYGKIRHISMTSPGANYLSLPSVTVDSPSARAQEIAYYKFLNSGNPSLGLEASPTNSAGSVNLFDAASIAALQASANGGGQVSRISIVTSGVNYLDANAVVVTTQRFNGRTGQEAEVTPVLGAVTTYGGRFLGTRGFLSADKVLQDETMYNDYTYQIRVGESFERYSTILQKLIHPAGFKMLGRFVDVMEANVPEGDLSDFTATDALVVVT